jgi:dihydrofolate reductase
MTLAALVITDENNAIGKSYNFISHLKAYLDFFHDLTKDYPVIQSRRTYEETGHLLSGKNNIVVTRSPDYPANGARVFSDIYSALEACTQNKAFIIGGGEFLKQSIERVSEIHRILIKVRFKSDLYYPEINTSDFELVNSECVNVEDMFFYCIEKWERKRESSF